MWTALNRVVDLVEWQGLGFKIRQLFYVRFTLLFFFFFYLVSSFRVNFGLD